MTDADLLALEANPPKRRAGVLVTPEMIARIRKLAAAGLEQSVLVRRFGLARPTISQIVNRRGVYGD